MKRLAFLLSGAAASFSLQSSASAQTAVPIRIGDVLSDAGLVPIYAQVQGILQQAGLAIEMHLFPNNGAVTQALVAGALDVAVIDALQVASAVAHGIPLTCFAGGAVFSKNTRTLVLVTAKSSGIQTALDLEGQSVAVSSLNSLSAAGTKEWLRVNGADPAKVKIFELGLGEMNAALARGTIAAALQGEPFLTDAKSEQRELGVPYSAIAPEFYINSFVASRDWITENISLAKRFANAMYQTARWANTHSTDSATIESRYSKIPIEVVDAMARNTFATSLDPRLIDPALIIGARYGLTPRLVQASEITFSL